MSSCSGERREADKTLMRDSGMYSFRSAPAKSEQLYALADQHVHAANKQIMASSVTISDQVTRANQMEAAIKNKGGGKIAEKSTFQTLQGLGAEGGRGAECSICMSELGSTHPDMVDEAKYGPNIGMLKCGHFMCKCCMNQLFSSGAPGEQK